MDVRQTRRLRLRQLIAEAGSDAKIAEAAVAAAAKISAKYLQQILGGYQGKRDAQPRQVGDRMARKLEVAFGRPHGWMDTPPGDVIGVAESAPMAYSIPIRWIPVLSLVQAGQWCEAKEPWPVPDDVERIPIPAKYGSRCYALVIRGDSMSPSYPNGTTVVVDPDREARHRSLVIARLDGTDEIVFKQLLLEGSRALLRALNPEWPEKIIDPGPSLRICGVVVYAGRETD